MSLAGFIEKNIVAPPHRWLLPVAFAVTALYFLCNPFGPVYTQALRDPDDYMRLNETINWLKGQGWYDLSQPRLSPGAHTVIHWSRLLDMPIAALMAPFLPALGIRAAAMLAGFIEPLILLGLLLMLVPRMAKPLLGRGEAKLAALIVPLIPQLLYNFTPGRTDHHNWDVLIAGVGLMALQALMLCRGGWKAGIFAAIAFALGLWISPEIVPCILLFLGCLALFSGWRGGFVLRNAAIFGVAFAVATAALLLAALPMNQWNDRTISWFSGAYAIFAALCGGIFVIAWLLGRRTHNKILRVALMAALSGFAAVLFVHAVPDVLQGPFADYDTFDATTALEDIGEAEPFILRFGNGPHSWHNPVGTFMLYLLPETLALIMCACALASRSRRRRALWLANGIFLGSTTALALFFQYRLLWFAQIFEIGPLAYGVWRLWDGFGGTWTIPQRLRAALLAFLMLGPVAVIMWHRWDGFGQGWAPQRRYRMAVLAFLFFAPLPVLAAALVKGGNVVHGCNLRPAADYISGAYPGTPTILASANEGPELLFRTPDNVIAANFDVPGNRDTEAFFAAHDDAVAENILRRWRAGLVLTCRRLALPYVDTDPASRPSVLFHGSRHPSGEGGNRSLAERLVNGPVPSWLKPVEIPGSTDYLLFEVHWTGDQGTVTAP